VSSLRESTLYCNTNSNSNSTSSSSNLVVIVYKYKYNKINGAFPLYLWTLLYIGQNQGC